jgi:hypothetical protein
VIDKGYADERKSNAGRLWKADKQDWPGEAAYLLAGRGRHLLIILANAMLTLPHRVGIKSVWVMVAAAWLTWAMAISEVANSWWGTSQMLPIAASQAGATGGDSWQEMIVALAHIGAALGLIAGLLLLIIGFLMYTPAVEPSDG